MTKFEEMLNGIQSVGDFIVEGSDIVRLYFNKDGNGIRALVAKFNHRQSEYPTKVSVYDIDQLIVDSNGNKVKLTEDSAVQTEIKFIDAQTAASFAVAFFTLPTIK